ncbi:MAG: hypothetical protein COB02_04905 [Candidatus Cloacimonadota bacterium]|nr:MAG: hypothetical protein COB02_04905 [Candidatus Cloacimonadota bacterium]
MNNKIKILSFKIKKELIEISNSKSNPDFLLLSTNKQVIDICSKKNHSLTTNSFYTCKTILKKLPTHFYTPSISNIIQQDLNPIFEVSSGVIEFFAIAKKFPLDKSKFFPVIKKKYPLLTRQDIIYYKYYPKIDLAKLLNFKFENKQLLLKLDFSIPKVKLSSFIFFIDKKQKLTRFVSI